MLSATEQKSIVPPSVEYLDKVRETKFAREYKQRTFDLLGVQPGHHILDLGCGTGNDVLALARAVGPSGKVVGLDRNPTMITECWQRASASNLPVEFFIGDGHDLKFPDGSFHACRSDRVFQHLRSPQTVLKELVRVLKAGGCIAISEPDWDTLVIDSALRETTRAVVRYMSDLKVPQGWIGRQLPRLFADAGLKEITVIADVLILNEYAIANHIWGLADHARRAHEAGFITSSDAEAWIAELQGADRAGRFFGASGGFLVRGVKPAAE